MGTRLERRRTRREQRAACGKHGRVYSRPRTRDRHRGKASRYSRISTPQ